MKRTFEQRRSTYFHLSNEIAQLSNQQLQALFEADADKTHGWGTNHTLTISGSKVFVKRVVLTDLEYENQFSTRNLYELPTFYNYGIGSAGFGTFRELVAHIKTTNWVLAGEIANFPLLYHYRIMPRVDDPRPFNEEGFERYITYWNSEENLRRFGMARRQARYEVVLFLEHFPLQFRPWLEENMGQIEQVLGELRDTITFLRQQSVIHFDAYFNNVMSDGGRPYLCDFGLVLDKRFDLSEAEQAFFEAHTHYDYGEVLASLSWLLTDILNERLEGQEKEAIRLKLGTEESAPYGERAFALLENIESLHGDGLLPLDADFVAVLVKHRAVIMFMQQFYGAMRGNERKDTPFDHERLKQLLYDAHFLT